MIRDLSDQNAAFWSEPCGSQLAAALGIQGELDENALRLFDEKYFQLYPYLKPFLEDIVNSSSDVLEIGLGMGAVSEWLASNVSSYIGLDIAEGPVRIVNNRLMRKGHKGLAEQGSILKAPFHDSTFDAIVAIGCLHHTSDLGLALQECHRLLKPGGKLKLMVYYAYSARRWFQSPYHTLTYLLRELVGYRNVVGSSTTEQRSFYDTNSLGEAAPHTDFISRKSLRSLCHDFQQVSCSIKNFESEGIWQGQTREFWINTIIPSIVGLDLYATLHK